MLGISGGLVLSLIENVLRYWFINKFLECRIKGPGKIAVLLPVVIADSLIAPLFPVASAVWRTLVIMALTLLLVHILYRNSIFLKVFLILLTEYVFIISDILTSNIFALANWTNLENQSCSMFELVIFFSIRIGILQLNSVFIRKLNFQLSIKSWVCIDIVLEALVVVVHSLRAINSRFSTPSPDMLWLSLRMSMYFLLMSLLITYLFGELFYQKEQQKAGLELQNKALEQQLATDEIAAYDLKRIRHDIGNNLANIAYLLKENCIEETIEYIQAIAATLEGTKPVIQCGSKYIDSILNYEIAVCKKQGIAVQFEIDRIPELSIAPTCLSSILSNVLNNAIEANLGLTEKERYLNVKMFCYKNYVSIVVVNPYYHKPIPANGLLRTSKPDKLHHGYGLSSIKTAVGNCGGTFKYSYNSHVFTSTIVIPISPVSAS